MDVNAILKSKGSEVATVGPHETVGRAADALKAAGVGALVVTEDATTPLGILSERDIARAVPEYGARLPTVPVRLLMSTDVVTCAPGDRIADIMAVMTDRRIRHLPVMQEGAMCGIISIGDVVKHRLDEIAQEADALREYIAGGA